MRVKALFDLIKNRLYGRSSLGFDAAAFNHIGGRNNLEDVAGDALIDPGTGCWVVADGVGGQGAGEVAAQLAVDSILQDFRSQPDCSEKQLRRWIMAAHQTVFAARQPNSPTANMATTVVALLAADNRAVWGHVGDSRLYHFRKGNIAEMTRDQSLANLLLARGALAEADLAAFAHRNVILYALGQDDTPEILTHGPIRLQAGDGFLLCSDGVWELASHDELLTIWQAGRSASDGLSALEQLITPRAEQKTAFGQSADNYTAIAIRVVDANA